MDIHVETCQLLALNAPLAVGTADVVFVILSVTGVTAISQLLGSFLGPYDAILHRPGDVGAVAQELDFRRVDLVCGFGVLYGAADQAKGFVAALYLVATGGFGIEEQVLGENIGVLGPVLAVEGPAVAGLGFADCEVIGKGDLGHGVLPVVFTGPST